MVFSSRRSVPVSNNVVVGHFAKNMMINWRPKILAVVSWLSARSIRGGTKWCQCLATYSVYGMLKYQYMPATIKYNGFKRSLSPYQSPTSAFFNAHSNKAASFRLSPAHFVGVEVGARSTNDAREPGFEEGCSFGRAMSLTTMSVMRFRGPFLVNSRSNMRFANNAAGLVAQ